ncbi:MAG: cyclic nucleotide-binding domain-containing protein [Chitinophagales bacterium]
MANLYFKDYTPVVHFKRAKPTHQECLNYLALFLKNFAFIEESDLQNLGKYFEYFSAKKNDIISSQGKYCEHIVFICKGAVKHVIENNNQQNVIELFTEANFCASIKSFISGKPAIAGFICSQNTYGLKLSLENFERLIQLRPAFEQLMNQMQDETATNYMYRLTFFQSLDSNGRYHVLLKEHPDAFEKFTMQDISNYLDIKAETLSRLRKKKEAEPE